MPASLLRPRPSRRSPSGSRSVILGAALVLVASGLAAPVSAAASAGAARGVSSATVDARSGSGLAGAARHAIGRDVGRGTVVDPRRAAREAAASPRALASTTRPRVDLGAGRTSGSGKTGTTPAPATRNLADGTTRSGAGTTSLGATAVVAQPVPVITTRFAGIAQADACACEPPDPWIAVSPLYVVQTTNGLVRISTRSGTTLMSMPTWALFAVPVDRIDSDPRILWDQVHGRWVGVITTYRQDFSASGLRLAVSETSNPTAAWIVYPIEYGGPLADYPGISSSSSRIVLTSDDFLNDSPGGWLGPTWIQMDWSNILAGTSLYIGGVSYRAKPGDPPPGFAHFRPAIMLSSAAVTPVVYENEVDDAVAPNPPDFHAVPGYFEIVGNAHSLPIEDNVDTDLRHLGTAEFTLPPAPVQPGALSIALAADERPTDAVYRNGSVWFTATGLYNDGAADWDKARWTRVATTANGIAPSGAADVFLFTSGVHYVMPGVGINGDNSAIMAVTAMDPTAMYPTTLVGGYLAGTGWTPPVPIETSPAAYVGDRWGDFLGIAADPSGAGSVWLAHELSDADGNWRTSVVRIVSDGTPPGSPGATRQAPVIPSTLGSTVPIRVSWGAAPDADSGIASYLVERSDDGGGFAGAAIPGTAITQPLLFGHTVRYRITPTDIVGLVGPPTYSPTFRPVLYQSTSLTTTSGTWGRSTASGFSGGSTRYASHAGTSLTFTATSARSIAIVSTKAVTRGSFKVYVDGVYRGAISTYSKSTKFRQLVFQFNWSSAGTHKVKVVVSGTAGHPRVDIDAFVVLR